MCRRHRPRRTAGLALQALAHRLAPSAHVTSGLHLDSQQLLVTMFFKCEQFQRARMKSLVHVTEHPGDGIGDTVGLHDPQQLTVGQFVAISIDQADHIPELHQTDVTPEIDEFLQPRLAEQVEHGEEELIFGAETGHAHPGHAGNGLLDRILKRFLDRDVKRTLCPSQAVGDIDVDCPSPRLIDRRARAWASGRGSGGC